MADSGLGDKIQAIGFGISDLAECMNLSRQTLYNYIKRYNAGNKDGIPQNERAVLDYINSGNASKGDVVEFIGATPLKRDIMAKLAASGETALMLGSNQGNSEAARALLDAGAAQGMTALMLAAQNVQNAEAIRALLAAGAGNGIPFAEGLGVMQGNKRSSILRGFSMDSCGRLAKFRNYRNIGVSKDGESETLRLNSSLENENIGELITVIGENNVGKSNILDALSVIKPPENASETSLCMSDAPYFMDYEDARPEVSLVYADNGGKSLCLRYFLDDEWSTRVQLDAGDEAFEVASAKRRRAEETAESIAADLACEREREGLDAMEEASSTLMEKYGIRLVPKIVYYKEKEIKDSDLVTTPAAIRDSRFFNALLKAAGTSVTAVAQAYEKAKANPGYKVQFQNTINERLEQTAGKAFNGLYFQGRPSQEYRFYISLEKEAAYLSIARDGNVILLSQQSASFRWFFNFFFNFLHAADLQAGDIVLMDEPDAHLAIPARRELRRFLKDFAKSTGITFIATAQNAEFIDPDFLDELRVIRQKRGEGEVGARIQNDFSATAEDACDTINEVLAAFGLRHRDIITDPDNTVIYVEGIADYNYLTAFKLLKETEESKGDEKKKIGLAFLPIGGLGKNEEQMKKKLPLLARHKDAVLLADSDKAGEEFKKICEDAAKPKSALTVVPLKEADASFTEIEDLFAPADKERHKEMIEDKSGSASALFKRNILELSEKGEIDGQTKANFYKVLDYLAGVTA